MDCTQGLVFSPELHKRYLYFILNGKLPSFLSSMDTNRSLLMYFAIAGLDVLNQVETIPPERRKVMIDWIYSLQIVNENECVSGFQGSPCLNTETDSGFSGPYKWAHIANTYACLITLLILGNDLGRVNKKAILHGLSALQLSDGSFKGAIQGVEDDMRFVYCAACIMYILDDWSAVDLERMVQFILNSISYDGGIGQGPELESHSGSTFCALASLALSNNLHRLSVKQKWSLKRWLVSRFEGGFSGRPNKPVDTCYSFWTGGALRILGAYEDVHNKEENWKFVVMTQDRYGGFSKWMNSTPDPMHTYMGLAGLSLMGYGNLEEMHCELNVTRKTHDFLKRVQANWK